MRITIVTIFVLLLSSFFLSDIPTNALGVIIGGGDGSEICRQHNLKVADECQPPLPDEGAPCCDHNVEGLRILEVDYVVAPGGTVLIEAEGSALPFVWTGSTDLYPDSESPTYSRSMLFHASEDFCGTATVSVSDTCAKLAQRVVRSTDGYWKLLHSGSPALCSLPTGGLLWPEDHEMAITTQGGWFVGHGLRASVFHGLNGWSWTVDGTGLSCPIGTVLTTHSEPYWTNYCLNYGYTDHCGFGLKEFSDGICTNVVNGTNQCNQGPLFHYFWAADAITYLYEWVCYE